MTEKTKKECPRRSDMYFAAFALSKGVHLKCVDKKSGRTWYVFDASEEDIKRLEIVYSNRGSEDSLVSAPVFADNIRTCKRLCHD